MPEERREPEELSPVPRELPTHLRAFEAALASLAPRGDRLDRDAVLYHAGRRAGWAEARRAGRRGRIVRSASLAAFSAAAAGLLVAACLRPEASVVRQTEQIEPVVEPSAVDQPDRLLASDSRGRGESGQGSDPLGELDRRWQEQMLRRGIDLDAPPGGLTIEGPIRPSRPTTYDGLLRELLAEQERRQTPG